MTIGSQWTIASIHKTKRLKRKSSKYECPFCASSRPLTQRHIQAHTHAHTHTQTPTYINIYMYTS